MQFIRFVLASAVAAAANIGSRALFGLWVPFVPAMVMAFVVGLTTAFLLNRRWVFRATGRHWSSEATWFTVVNLLGLAQTLAISWILARHVFPHFHLGQCSETLAHSIGVVVPMITSFIGHKYLSFRGQRHD